MAEATDGKQFRRALQHGDDDGLKQIHGGLAKNGREESIAKHYHLSHKDSSCHL
jgi:hypothetical protein